MLKDQIKEETRQANEHRQIVNLREIRAAYHTIIKPFLLKQAREGRILSLSLDIYPIVKNNISMDREGNPYNIRLCDRSFQELEFLLCCDGLKLKPDDRRYVYSHTYYVEEISNEKNKKKSFLRFLSKMMWWRR